MDASNIHPSRREVYEPWISPPHGQLGHDQDFVVQSYARLLDRVTNENKTLAAKAKELEESANDVEDEKAELQKEHDTYFARVAGYEELIGVLWARIPADEQGSDMPAELVNDEQLCRSAKDFLNNLVSVNEAQKEELAELRKHYAVANTEKTKAMESEARLQREVRRMRGEAEEHQRGHEEALQVARERDEVSRVKYPFPR
jgi:chromosome segregation ATPase